MKPDELKLRVCNYADGLIDKIFPQQDMFSKLKGATAKYWVKQNIWRLDDILCAFVDCNGEIDPEEAMEFYASEIFDENGQFSINIKDIMPESGVSQFLPNKMIVFTKADLKHIFGSHDDDNMHSSNNRSPH